MAYQYHRIVPRELRENLDFRARMWKEGFHSESKARAIRAMCAADPLFFINTFCWTLHSKWNRRYPVQPFITFPAQERAIQVFEQSIHDNPEERDVVNVKSREWGATYLALYLPLRYWLIYPMQLFLLVSRVEKRVYNPGDPVALFSKLEFTIDCLPSWMRPTFEVRENRLVNKENGSAFVGEATTGDVGRAGRYGIGIFDEFAAVPANEARKALASTQDACATRWFISTPQGIGHPFYDLWHGIGGVNPFKIESCWEDMPQKRRGLYATGPDGRVQILDESYDFPPDYPFVLDGWVRSPWFDAWCRRNPYKPYINQELRRDFIGSGSQFFDGDQLKVLIETCAKKPYHVGRINGDGKFEPVPWDGSPEGAFGKLCLWMQPMPGGVCARDRAYAGGVDVSAGTGASNSALSIVDLKTGVKVGEFATPHLSPDRFAEECNRIGRWFRDTAGEPAQLVFENQGPGTQFRKAMADLGYGALWVSYEDEAAGTRRLKSPGVMMTDDFKRILLSDYANAMLRGEFVNRSEWGLRECQSYEYQPNGSIAHVRAAAAMDPSGAKKNHGDMVIADALACFLLRQLGGFEAEDDRMLPKRETVEEQVKRALEERREEDRAEEGWLVG